MSRIGFWPINIPEKVDIELKDDAITVKGDKGELTKPLHESIEVKIEDGILTVERLDERKESRAIHGTTRSLIANMIEGVKNGYEKELEIVGVGYRAQKQGKRLTISAGYSHLVEIDEPEGVEFDVPENTRIIVKGIDKELVGTVAARIRATKVPEPYKGKGIRYKDEYVRRKEGKTAT